MSFPLPTPVDWCDPPDLTREEFERQTILNAMPVGLGGWGPWVVFRLAKGVFVLRSDYEHGHGTYALTNSGSWYVLRPAWPRRCEERWCYVVEPCPATKKRLDEITVQDEIPKEKV